MHYHRGLMFHHFHDETSTHPPSQGSMSASQFEALLNHVGLENILSAESWLQRVLSATLKPHHRCLTFDDALLCQIDVALPVLRRLGLSAFWFVYSSPFKGGLDRLEIYRKYRTTHFSDIDAFYTHFFSLFLKIHGSLPFKDSPYLLFQKEWRQRFPFYSEGDLMFRFLRDKVLGPTPYDALMETMMVQEGVSLKEMAKDLWLTERHLQELVREGHCIGLHSYDHPTQLATLSKTKQYQQYQQNREHLEKVIGCPIVTMSHPCGSYSEETLEILKDMGILCGFRSDPFAPDQRGVNPTHLELAREDHATLLKEMNFCL